jgi:hypothetical protein
MSIRRSLSCLVVLAVALTLSPRGSAAAPDPAERGSSDQLFQAYSEFFFVRRDLDFAMEMSLRESFLTWLYGGISEEVYYRSKEDPAGTLEAISPPEISGLDEEDYNFPDSLLDAPLRIRYLAMEEYQRTEFNHKYLQARLMKDRLIQRATPDQRRRMFKRDLESTFMSFRDNLYRESILAFDELIDRYGFTDVSDLAFYRGESYLGIQLYEKARENYQLVLDSSTDPWFKSRALERLQAFAGDHGDMEILKSLWSQYASEAGDKKSPEFWETAFSTARYLISGREWKLAQQIFDSIPADFERYQEATLRGADCSFYLRDFDNAKNRYGSLLDVKKGKKAPAKPLAIEANLKLGYIDYLEGHFEEAFTRFNGIEAEGEMAERVTLAAIWSLYRLSSYQQVIERSNQFLLDFPASQYQYEARSLAGYSQDMMGRSDVALSNYKEVMSALDDRQDFYDFNFELEAIERSLGKAQELESAIFLGGERDLFPDYLEVHRNLQKLVDGIRFARALKSTPMLKEVIQEQKDLFQLYKEQDGLEAQIMESQDTKLFDQYQDVLSQLTDIGSQLTSGLRYFMKQKSLIQREQDNIYEMQKSDSLRAQLAREWAASEAAVMLVRKYRDNSRGADAMTLVELTSVETRLSGLQDRILRVQSELHKYGQQSVVSNLDAWSDFAYQRYTYGGLNFDYLYSQENRVNQLDEYIQKVGSLLQQREALRADTMTIAANLRQSGKAGDQPFFAPSVPLWGAVKPGSPFSDDAGKHTGEIPKIDAAAPGTSPKIPPPVAEPAPVDMNAPPTTPTEQPTAPSEETGGQPAQEGGQAEPVVPSSEPAPVEPAPEEAAPDTTGKSQADTPPAPAGEENPQNGPSAP